MDPAEFPGAPSVLSLKLVESIVIPTGAERSERSGGTCFFSQPDLRGLHFDIPSISKTAH
jgi:hypothetical protein